MNLVFIARRAEVSATYQLLIVAEALASYPLPVVVEVFTSYSPLWWRFQSHIYCLLWRRFQPRINCTLWLRYRPHIYCPLWYRPHTPMWWRFQSHCSRGISLIIIARGGGSIRLIFIYLPCIAGCGRSVSLIMIAALAKVSSTSYCGRGFNLTHLPFMSEVLVLYRPLGA